MTAMYEQPGDTSAPDGVSSASSRDTIAQRLLALRDSGLALATAGDLAGGIDALTTAVTLASDHFGASEWATRAMRITLGELLSAGGKHRGAIQVLSAALDAWPSPIRTARELEALGDCSFLVGVCHDALAENADASIAYTRAFEAYQRVLPPSDARLVRAASNTAEMARMRNDAVEAERWFRRAEGLEVAARGTCTEQLALIRNNLGETLVRDERVEEGIALIVSALRIRFRTAGKRSSRYARSLTALGAAEAKRGRLAAAVKAMRRANDTYHLVQDTRGMLSTGMMLAQARGYDGHVDEAIAYLRNNMPGEHDPEFGGREYLDQYVELAKLYMLSARWEEARGQLLHALDELNDETLEVAQTSSQRHMRTVVAHAREVLHLLAAATLLDTQRAAADITLLYREVQRRKGIETRWLRLQQPNAARAGLLPDQVAARETLRANARELLASRQALARVRLEAAVEAPDATMRSREAALSASIDAQESAFARRSASFWMQYDVAGDLLVSVDTGDVILEYLRITVDIGNPAQQRVMLDVYSAFVLTNDQPLALHDLGSASAMDSAIDAWRGAIIDPPAPVPGSQPAWRRQGAELYARLCSPIADRIASTTHLFIAPDAKVHEVAFHTLPVSDDVLLVDRVTTSLLLAGSEYRRERLIIETPLLENEPMVIAAPDFGDAPAGAASAWTPFPELPETSKEGHAVHASVGGSLLTGSNATAQSIAALVSPEILHIATHSFLLAHVADNARAPTDLLEARSRLMDPMERCGIALAGANVAVLSRDGDGESPPAMLFGSDVALMDLRKTDLVVLSSCVSGLGDVEPGEGLLGLRRAFKAAGAHSVVCSLWPVPDDATQRIMTHFYARLLAQRPRADALRDAMQVVRDTYPDDPFCWGAFVLDGAATTLLRFSPVARLRVASVDAATMEAWSGQWAAALDAAEERHREGDDDASLHRIESILSSDGATDDTRAGALVLRAAIRRSRDDMAGAESDCSDALALDIMSLRRAAALYARGIARMMLERWTEAASDFTGVLGLSDESAPEWRVLTLVNRSLAFMQLGALDDAKSDLDVVLRDDATPAAQRLKALANRGECARLLGDAIAMRRDWSEAVSIVPSPEPALREQLIGMLAMDDDALIPGDDDEE
ncbi:MAG: CHAT domain-containing protein [Gemmatimonadaceae bacterium]|nr:CHAT domain-containing protein [Gemmatimonadaceae bacterium]